MPTLAPPPIALTPPVQPVVVRRGYRDAPPFQAGARRTVRLAVAPGAAVVAPCDGAQRFVGSVGGGPPVVSIDCAQGGLRVTLSAIGAAYGRGATVHAGAPVGRALGQQLGVSVRRGGAYVDPLTLLRRRSRTPQPPIASARRPRRPLPAPPPVRGLRTLRVAHDGRVAAPPVTPDRWLGIAGVLVGVCGAAGALCAHRWRHARGAGAARQQTGARRVAIRR